VRHAQEPEQPTYIQRSLLARQGLVPNNS